MTDHEVRDRIRQALDLMREELREVKSTDISSLIIGCAFMDAAGTFLSGKRSEGGRRYNFVGFVNAYFNRDGVTYDPDILWEGVRSPVIHSFIFSGLRGRNLNSPDYTLINVVEGHSVDPGDGTTGIHPPTFVDHVLKALDRYEADLLDPSKPEILATARALLDLKPPLLRVWTNPKNPDVIATSAHNPFRFPPPSR